MNWISLKNTAKWLWIAVMLAFVIFYAVSKKAMVLQAFSMLSLNILLGSALLIFLAKLCLVVNMRQAARHFTIDLGWVDCYCIYNLTQLGKYIPGSIWQFIGRIAILRERDVSAQVIRDSLLAEHFWVIGSAGVMTSVLIFVSHPDFFALWLAGSGIELKETWLLIAVGVIVISLAVGFLLSSRLSGWLVRLFPPVHAIPVLLFTWLFLGASLWVMLTPFVDFMPALPYVVGIYCFAYLVGFLVPFAPAGLGIREAVLTFALMPYLDAEMAILLTAVNRILYFAVEVLAAAVCATQKTIISQG